MTEKKIDLGEGCEIKITSYENGSKDFCINCEGEEEFKFHYKGKGTQIKSIEKAIEKVEERLIKK